MMDDDDFDYGYEYYHHAIFGWQRREHVKPPFILSILPSILFLAFLLGLAYDPKDTFEFWMLVITLIVEFRVGLIGIIIEAKRTKKKELEEQKKLEQDKDDDIDDIELTMKLWK